MGSGAIDLDAVRKGRTMLWIALLAQGAMLLSGFGRNPLAGVLIVAWLVSFFAGLGGVSLVASGAKVSTGAKYLGLVGAVFPGVNLVSLVSFLVVARGAQQEEQRPRRPPSRSTGAAERPAPQPAPAPPPRMTAAGAQRAADSAEATRRAGKSRVKQAVAYAKHAGLGGQPEGKQLQMRLSQPGIPDVPADQLPVIRCSKGEFGVLYAVDEGEGFTFITGQDLKTEGVGIEDVHRMGLRNLAAKIEGDRGLSLRPHGAFHALILDGNFEASLPLVDGLWDGPLRQYAPNGFVLAVPARDICAFCDTHSREGIAELEALVKRVTAGGDHLLTEQLLTRENGIWKPFDTGRAELAPLEFKL